MKSRAIMWMAMVTLAVGMAWGESTTAPATQGTGGPAPALDPEARDVLKMLQDRRGTLKDFQAKVKYDVTAGRGGDVSGKLGTVDYANDPSAGPTFSVRFTLDTVDGVPQTKIHEDIAFDGTNLFIIDHTGRKYVRRAVSSGGAGPGGATSLDGQLPLPIGVKVEEVAASFEVTVTATEGDRTTLKLVPREAGRFDFRQLELTVDKKLQLSVKVVRTEKNKDKTTIEFSDIAINTGKSKMVDTSVPAGAGWDLDLK